MENYLAHIYKDGEQQTIQEHAINTAKLSASFAIPELSDICYALGLFHDIGKYQKSFQARIRGASVKIEHANCGAIVCFEIYGQTPLGLLLALCIVGHHGSIPDCGSRYDRPDAVTLYGRIHRKTESFDKYKQEITIPDITKNRIETILQNICRTEDEVIESYAFLTRYCYSCLTDADTLDSGRRNINNTPANFQTCMDVIQKKITSFTYDTDIKRARLSLQKQALSNIETESDLYLMQMPTGAGKTLASMSCALKKAIQTGKKRIIYVIPYNSIIDQTVEIFESLFGQYTQIIRHQSSFSYEEQEDISEDIRQSSIYACENWDAPFIFTTAVQFYESVYSSRKGKLRKLHNMADSIIVLDEVHMMPVEYLQPCLRAVSFITKYLHSQALLLSATMPDFSDIVHRYALQTSVVTDLIQEKSEFRYFKKNSYSYIGSVSDVFLKEQASLYPSSLIIVNSKKHVQELYANCTGKKYHLSTYMTGKDRANTISAIRQELALLQTKIRNGDSILPNDRIVVISTSLVEAGVDFDFHAVFRELAGLDNILQAGGRCNREGLLQKGHVYVFEGEGYAAHNIEQNLAKNIMQEFKDIDKEEVIKTYYSRLYKAKKDDITKQSLQCSDIFSIPFRTYGDRFHLIKTTTVSIMVIQDAYAAEQVQNAEQYGYMNNRNIQKYCCTVQTAEYEKLLKSGGVKMIGGVPVLAEKKYYDANIGLVIK